MANDTYPKYGNQLEQDSHDNSANVTVKRNGIYGWNTSTLQWERVTSSSGVLQVSSSGGGGGAATIADGADVAEGATTDIAVTSDATGTVSGKLRGLVKMFADMWDSTNHRLNVADANSAALGAKIDAKNAATDTTSVSIVSILKQISAYLSAALTVNVNALGTIYNGKTTVTTAGTRVTLAASQAITSVVIKALAANTGKIYVGNASVASTNGFQLAAGESVSMDITNLNTINIDSAVNGEGVSYIAIG